MSTALIKHSFFCRGTRAFINLLLLLWSQSTLANLFKQTECAMKAAFQKSVIADFLLRDGILSRQYEHSTARRSGTALLEAPFVLAARAGAWVPLRNSVFVRMVSSVGAAAHILIGFLFLVMLITPHSAWNNAYALYGAIGILLLFFAGAMRHTRRIESPSKSPYFLFYMLFLLYGFVASLNAAESIRFFLFHVSSLLLAALAVSAVQCYRDLKAMLIPVLAGISAAGLYGCAQGIRGVAVVASQQDMLLNAGMPGRVYSFFDNPNNFAQLLVMLLPLLFALFLNAKTLPRKGLILLGILPCAAAIGFTYSRSGWIGLAAAIFVFLCLRNWRMLPLFFLSFIVLLPFLPDSILNRILTIWNMKDTSTAYRFAIYEASANLMRDFWHRGVGLGTDVMKSAFRRYPTMFDGNHPIHTHNNYLQMWGEIGILGLLSYVGMLLSRLKSGIKAYKKAVSPEIRNLLCASIGAYVGMLVIGFAEYTWFYPRNMFLFWFLFSVIGACVKFIRQPSLNAL